MNPTCDQIAREAARLIELGRADSIAAAIRRAMESVHHVSAHHSESGGTPDAPSHGLVRRHLQGFAMQSLGEAGYRDEVDRILRIAEEIMTLFEENARPILAGRAAKGHIDGGVTLHIRIYTNERVEVIAQTLVDADCEEPYIETINTRWGRINRFRFVEDGCDVVVSRLLPNMWKDRARNLFRDEPVAIIDLDALRARLAVE